MMMASCSSLKVVDQNAAANAGAAALQALSVSDAQIAQLCSQYMVETDGQNTILPASNDYTQRLNRIMARFHNISNLNLNYKVYQSNEVNAFASGDGSVRVYTGLMDVMNDDQVFAVIGHELGHLINKDVRDASKPPEPSRKVSLATLDSNWPKTLIRAVRKPKPTRPLSSSASKTVSTLTPCITL